MATRDLGGGYSALETVSLSGKVTSLTLSGSAKAHADIIDPTHAVIDTCDRTVSLQGRRLEGQEYAGVTSQRRPIVVEFTANGASVHHLHIGWQAFCASAGRFSWGDTLVNFPISRGRFGDTFSQKYSNPDGTTSVERYSLRGGISGPRVAGTFRWQETDSDATGATTDTCDTGPLPYRTNSG